MPKRPGSPFVGYSSKFARTLQYSQDPHDYSSMAPRPATISRDARARAARRRAALSAFARMYVRDGKFRRPRLLRSTAVRRPLDAPIALRFKRSADYAVSTFVDTGNPTGDVSKFHNFFCQPLNPSSGFSYIGGNDVTALTNLYKEFRVKSWKVTFSRPHLVLGGAAISGTNTASEITTPIYSTIVHTSVANDSSGGSAGDLIVVPHLLTPMPATGLGEMIRRTGNTVCHNQEQVFVRYWYPNSPAEKRWSNFDASTVQGCYGGCQARVKDTIMINQQGEETSLNNDQVLVNATLEMVIELRGRR